jgi:prolyl-tRNA editing enzyme YbaK/EbsC (Cys-tRNA(Pro) deacylase)
MEYHQTVAKIVNLLKEGGFWYETFEHEPVRTSEEAAKVRTGYTLAQGAKAMIVRVKKSSSEKFFAMLVLPGDRRFDIDKVERLFEARDIRFATEAEVATITGGVLPGGVPPLGNLFGLQVVADPLLFENEKMVFNAGDRSFSIAMKTEDYRKVVGPRVEKIV